MKKNVETDKKIAYVNTTEIFLSFVYHTLLQRLFSK